MLPPTPTPTPAGCARTVMGPPVCQLMRPGANPHRRTSSAAASLRLAPAPEPAAGAGAWFSFGLAEGEGAGAGLAPSLLPAPAAGAAALLAALGLEALPAPPPAGVAVAALGLPPKKLAMSFVFMPPRLLPAQGAVRERRGRACLWARLPRNAGAVAMAAGLGRRPTTRDTSAISPLEREMVLRWAQGLAPALQIRVAWAAHCALDSWARGCGLQCAIM